MSGFAAARFEGKRRLVSLKPADNSEATMFTASGNVTVLAIAISNNTGGGIAATVRWRDASASTDYDIIAVKDVAANDTLFINEIPLVLKDADLIKITSATGNALTFTLLIVEALGAIQG